jgi:hypothetical protein
LRSTKSNQLEDDQADHTSSQMFIRLLPKIEEITVRKAQVNTQKLT